MSATAISKYFDRPEQLVDTTTVFTQSEVTSGPFFSLGVRQSLETTIQLDWQNNTGDIDIQLYSRVKPCMNYMLMKFIDCDGQLVDRLNMSSTFGSHMIHISRKFNDIDIRFVVNSGQADVKVSGLVE
jgi:hypothetical protein